MNDDIKPVDINDELQNSSPPNNFESPNPAQPPTTSFSQPPVTMGSPPGKKSRKKLYTIVLTVIIVALVAIGGGAAYALWYTNPEKVVADAVDNIIKSPSSITNAYFESKTKSGDKLTVTFDTQTDNPKLAGSLSAKVSVDTQEFKINLSGAGMVSQNGDLYFKVNNTQELIDKLLVTDYGKLYAKSPTLVKALKDFAKKIDGRWIKIDTKDIQDMLDSQGYKKQRQCYQNALSKFYENKDQQSQVMNAYGNNKFIIVKDSTDRATINGVDSSGYNISWNVQKSNDFSDAVEKTDVAKAVKKCDTSSDNSYQNPKPTKQEIKQSQKEVDKAKLKLWVSKWDHNLTGVDASYDASDGTSNTLKVKTDFKNKPQLQSPKNALSLMDLQQDINRIFSTPEVSQITTASTSSGVQAKARDTKRRSDALFVRQAAESFNINNGRYPTSKADFMASGNSVRLDSSVVLRTVSSKPTAVYTDSVAGGTNDHDAVAVQYCSGTGIKIFYWQQVSGKLQTIVAGSCASSNIS